VNRGADLVALAGRVLLSSIFLVSGWGKLMAPTATTRMMAGLGLPLPPAAYFVTVLVELGAGLAVLLGLRTRLAALVLALFCVATAFLVHYHPGDRMQMINFAKNLAIAGGFLQLIAWGPGRWSVDRR
jgi:putative oxidoreductase